MTLVGWDMPLRRLPTVAAKPPPRYSRRGEHSGPPESPATARADREGRRQVRIEEVFSKVAFRGDSVIPRGGGHDLRLLTAETVARLPKRIRDWLLYRTMHVFIGGHGQLGEYMPLCFSPEAPDAEKDAEGFLHVRMIFLSEQLVREKKEDVLWTIAHEIAVSWMNHDPVALDASSPDVEGEAGRIVKRWGFEEPSGRAADRELYKITLRGHAPKSPPGVPAAKNLIAEEKSGPHAAKSARPRKDETTSADFKPAPADFKSAKRKRGRPRKGE